MAAKTVRGYDKLFGLTIVVTYVINNPKSSSKTNMILEYIVSDFSSVINCPSKMFGFSFFCASSYLSKEISKDSSVFH